MRACPTCHTRYPDEAAVCPVDGSRLAAAAAPAPAELRPITFDGDPALPGDDREEAPTGFRTRGSGHDAPTAPAAGAGSPDPTAGPGDPAAPRRAERPDPLLGQVLGSYRLLSILGRGGMGRVYLAEHVKLGRQVALKLLRPEYAVKRDAVARFFQEARAVNKIRHRNIVDVSDFVELPDGRTFIIMELLKGSNLGELQRRVGVLPAPRAQHILLQVAEALEAAHREGIIHRDLKPDNVFVLDTPDEPDGVRLLDFGVAKLLTHEPGDDLGWQTAAGSVVGTPQYMSPEQAGGIPVDHRSDVYALGAIMYEVFTGQPLFRAKSFGEFVVKHMSEPPVPPRSLPGARGVSPALEAVILKALEKSPAARFQSAAELRTELARVLSSEATVLGPAPTQPRSEPPRPALSGAGTDPRRGAAQTASGSVLLVSGDLKALDAPASGASGALMGPAARLTGPESGESATGIAGEVTPAVGAGIARRRGGLAAAMIGFGLVVGGAVAYLLVGGSRGERPVAAAVPSSPLADLPVVVAPLAQPAATTAPVGRATRQVKLTIQSVPTGAEVMAAEDPSVVLGTTPLERTFEADGAERELVLRARGYLEQRTSVRLDEDRALLVTLVRAPAPVTARRPIAPASARATAVRPDPGRGADRRVERRHGKKGIDATETVDPFAQ